MKIAAQNYINQTGYTLIEAMLCVAIVAILSSVTIPAMTSTLNKASIQSTRQTLIEDIRLLRSFARHQHAAAYLCAKSLTNECVQSPRWNNGWFGFLDHNESGHFDEEDEIVVDYLPVIKGNTQIFIHTRWQKIKIDEQGVIRSSGHFRICDARKRGIRKMKVVRMNVQGRLRVESDKLDCA